MRRRINRPSPALVISVVALFVSLGGTGYAATQLAKNSVGAKHLKKNAVSSAKVKNSSLLLGDFRASERSKLRGAAGATGARGAAGARGVPGAAGRAGCPRAPRGTPGDSGQPGARRATRARRVIQGRQGADGRRAGGREDDRAGVHRRQRADGPDLSDDVQCQAGESVVGGGADIGPASLLTTSRTWSLRRSRPADAAGAASLPATEPRGWFVERGGTATALSHRHRLRPLRLRRRLTLRRGRPRSLRPVPEEESDA